MISFDEVTGENKKSKSKLTSNFVHPYGILTIDGSRKTKALLIDSDIDQLQLNIKDSYEAK